MLTGLKIAVIGGDARQARNYKKGSLNSRLTSILSVLTNWITVLPGQ